MRSMEYAKTVDRAYCGGTLHTSFQIRLPYVKGMLHQVDFKEFLSCAGMKTITDLWGTVHDVANVDIILTKSMDTSIPETYCGVLFRCERNNDC